MFLFIKKFIKSVPILKGIITITTLNRSVTATTMKNTQMQTAIFLEKKFKQKINLSICVKTSGFIEAVLLKLSSSSVFG